MIALIQNVYMVLSSVDANNVLDQTNIRIDAVQTF